MIVTLTGNNSLMLQQELHRRITDFVETYSDMGLERFDGEEAEYDRMREALESLPFLASKKMVVLRLPGANKQFVEHAEKLFAELPETTEVIVVEPKLDKRSVYYKLLKKVTDFKDFTELDGVQLGRWLTDYAKDKGGLLSAADARYLVDRVGSNQQLLANELDKLIVYAPAISRQSIDLLCEPAPQSTVFQLVDAAFAGNDKRVLALYREQRAQNVEPQAIIGMLAWQLHIIALIASAESRSDSDISREAKLSPFVVQKSRALTRRVTPAQIKQQVRDLLRLDISLKSSAIDADDAVQAFLLNLT